MKTGMKLCALLALATLVAPPLAAQKTAAEAARARELETEDRKKSLEGIEGRYKTIGQLAGSWEGNFKLVLQGQPPQEVAGTGTMQASWVLGDKWLQNDIVFKLPDGQPSHSNLTFIGFNTGVEKYRRVLLTHSDPREVLQTGTWDEAAKTFVFTGLLSNPFTGDSFDRRDTFKILDADQVAYSLDFVFPDKSEIHVIEGTFKRKK